MKTAKQTYIEALKSEIKENIQKGQSKETGKEVVWIAQQNIALEKAIKLANELL